MSLMPLTEPAPGERRSHRGSQHRSKDPGPRHTAQLTVSDFPDFDPSDFVVGFSRLWSAWRGRRAAGQGKSVSCGGRAIGLRCV